MTPTRSAMDSASSWSWVTNKVVVPSRCCRVRICSRSCSRTLASSADSGSSSSSTRGSIARARASATRCCWPPDSWCGYCPACGASPTMSSSSAARLRRSARADLAHPQAERHVVERVHVREQGVGLEHHAHVPLGRRERRTRPCRRSAPRRNRRTRTRRRSAARSSCRSRTGRAGRRARPARCPATSHPAPWSRRTRGSGRAATRWCRRRAPSAAAQSRRRPRRPAPPSSRCR